MRQGTCSECAIKGPLQTYFRHRDRIYCDACTTKLAQPDTGKFHGLEPPSAIVDPTICARCKADNGHFFFCRLFRLAVYDVCFFRFGNPAGYVIHERTDNFRAFFFVSLGPFFLNTLLCMVFCTAAFLPVWELKVQDPLAYFFYWLGLSSGMHAFPSKDDLANIWEMAPERARHGNVLAVTSLPLMAILYVLNYARIVWADLGYGIAMGILGPIALFRALA